MHRFRLWFLSAIVAGIATLALPSHAEAGFPYPAGYGCWGAGWGFYTQDYIPYFSRHPPVYYSFPVKRTYGYSPWAYPPGVLTPEYRLRPETTFNPYVPRPTVESAPAEQAHTARVQPLRIRNPFVELTEATEVAAANDPRQIEPQRIYPVAQFDAQP